MSVPKTLRLLTWTIGFWPNTGPMVDIAELQYSWRDHLPDPAGYAAPEDGLYGSNADGSGGWTAWDENEGGEP